MYAFVVSFSVLRQEIGWEECLQNDVLCVWSFLWLLMIAFCYTDRLMWPYFESVGDCLWTHCWLMQTHSAYMLFYERMKVGETSSEAPIDISPPDTADGSSAICRLDADDDDRHKMKIELSPELAEVVILTLTLIGWASFIAVFTLMLGLWKYMLMI